MQISQGYACFIHKHCKSKHVADVTFGFSRRIVREKEWAGIVVFAVFVISLMTTFILDAVIAHNIYTSRTNRYGDVLSVLHVLSFGLLRLIFLFARRNKKEQVPASI